MRTRTRADLNMDPMLRKVFEVLAKEGTYSWMGMASLFVGLYGDEDISEFVNCLQLENDKRNPA